MKKTTKIKGKYHFNIVDILLLSLIVISICAIVLIFMYDGANEKAENGQEFVEIIFTLEQSNMPDKLRGKINMGDNVLNSNTLDSIGTVINFQYTDSIYTAFDPETNTAFEGLYPGKIDLNVKLSAKAVVDNSGIYYVNGQRICAGEKMQVRFPFYGGDMVCLSVSEVSE